MIEQNDYCGGVLIVSLGENLLLRNILPGFRLVCLTLKKIGEKMPQPLKQSLDQLEYHRTAQGHLDQLEALFDLGNNVWPLDDERSKPRLNMDALVQIVRQTEFTCGIPGPAF